MVDVTVLLPDFALIGLGFAVCRFTPLGRPVWDGIDRLVYQLLFPALLFATIVRQPILIGPTARFVAVGLGATLSGIVLAWAIGRLRGVDPMLHASGAQTAFRFNSFVTLALAERLAGAEGLAWIAVLMSLNVPLCNVAAVWPLARHGDKGIARELARNPLIIATLGGLAFNLAGLRLPELASLTLARIGSAAIPLGLMAAGAGLHFGALKAAPWLSAGLLSIRHVAMPAVGIALALAAGLPAAQQLVVVAFSAMPTASSAYVLAARMGGAGGYVAGLVTVSTLLAMVGLPAALAALAALR